MGLVPRRKWGSCSETPCCPHRGQVEGLGTLGSRAEWGGGGAGGGGGTWWGGVAVSRPHHLGWSPWPGPKAPAFVVLPWGWVLGLRARLTATAALGGLARPWGVGLHPATPESLPTACRLPVVGCGVGRKQLLLPLRARSRDCAVAVSLVTQPCGLAEASACCILESTSFPRGLVQWGRVVQRLRPWPQCEPFLKPTEPLRPAGRGILAAMRLPCLGQL